MTKLVEAGCMAMLVVLEARAQQDLILRVESGNVPGPMLTLAKREAAQVLSQTGAHIHWKNRDDRTEAHRQLCECTTQAVDISVIDILIQDRTPAADHPGALGYALPFAKSGFRVVVFSDRVFAATEMPSPQLLGHVIAHEVGHMLMGTLSHAPMGVMKARWKGSEVSSMKSHPLTFTPGDADMISRRFSQQRISCMTFGARASIAPPVGDGE